MEEEPALLLGAVVPSGGGGGGGDGDGVGSSGLETEANDDEQRCERASSSSPDLMPDQITRSYTCSADSTRCVVTDQNNQLVCDTNT